MINKCSNRKELSYFDHQSTVIRPINILLNIGQTILICDIIKIDVKHVSFCFFILGYLIIVIVFRLVIMLEQVFL